MQLNTVWEADMAELNLTKLNELAIEPLRMIADAEDDYHERIGHIAEYITLHKGIKLILLAGPSGSGKTTTANFISDAIRERGLPSLVISLDDFYRDHSDPEYPKNAEGKHDYERPESLDLLKIEKTLTDVIENREFIIPKYDFKSGSCVKESTHAPIGDGCVIIEGLHALNPIISKNLPREKLVTLFVSVSTNINHMGKRIISGRKIRFLRRLVRDSIYRGSSAERTLSLWQDVLLSEDVYLYPYKASADLAFDTFHPFELGVMRNLADRLLTDKLARDEIYIDIVKSAIELVTPIDPDLVPDNSLIREFISGGIYDEKY